MYGVWFVECFVFLQVQGLCVGFIFFFVFVLCGIGCVSVELLEYMWNVVNDMDGVGNLVIVILEVVFIYEYCYFVYDI